MRQKFFSKHSSLLEQELFYSKPLKPDKHLSRCKVEISSGSATRTGTSTKAGDECRQDFRASNSCLMSLQCWPPSL